MCSKKFNFIMEIESMKFQIIQAFLLAFILSICFGIFFQHRAFAEHPAEKIFIDKACSGCHTIGKGKLAGPDLLGVTERRETEWLKKWLKSPDTMILTDPIAKEMLKEYFVPMPNQGLTDGEIELLIEYFKKNDNENKK